MELKYCTLIVVVELYLEKMLRFCSRKFAELVSGQLLPVVFAYNY